MGKVLKLILGVIWCLGPALAIGLPLWLIAGWIGTAVGCAVFGLGISVLFFEGAAERAQSKEGEGRG